MADVKTRADSLRFYLTGAGSDGGSQSDPDASLGGNRSSTRTGGLGFSVSNPISNVTIDFIAGENGEGDGTLDAPTVDTLQWTPPGGSAGAEVTIANGESKVIHGADEKKYIIVSRTSTSDLSGTATLSLSIKKNNVVGLDNVTSTEASNGDKEYRAVAIKNENTDDVDLLKIYLNTLGTQQTSDDGQLGASGSGSISTTGSFSDWPDVGYCRIEDSGGTLREIVYYSSRTATTLTIPSAGRGLLGTTAAAGASDDKIDAIPGMRIGTEDPGSQPSGSIQQVGDEDSAPSGITWNTGIDAAGGIDYGTLAADNWTGLWVEREVPAGAVAQRDLLKDVAMEFDASGA